MKYINYENNLKKKLSCENLILDNNIRNLCNDILFFKKFLNNLLKKYNYLNLYNFGSKEYFYRYEGDLLLYNTFELICNLENNNLNDYIINIFKLTYNKINNRLSILELIKKEYYDISINYYNLSVKYKKDFKSYSINIKKKISLLKKKKNDLIMKKKMVDIFNKFYNYNINLINNNKFILEDMNLNNKFELSIDFYNDFNIKNNNIIIEFIIKLLNNFESDNLNLLFKYVKYFVYEFNYNNVDNNLIEKLLKYYIKIEKNNCIYDYEKINMKKNIIYFCDKISNELNKIDENILINYIYIVLTDISNYIVEINKLDKELEDEKKKEIQNQVEINLIIKEKSFYLILVENFNNVIKKCNINILLKSELINKFVIVYNDFLNLLLKKTNDNINKINDILKLYNKMNKYDSNIFLKSIINDERYSYKNNLFEKINKNIDNEEIVNLINNYIKDNNKDNIIIPEKFCDPLYCTMINSPIELPVCLTIMDENIIKEYLLLKNENPFNRTYLNLELLNKHNEDIEVKKRIILFKEELKLWKKENNIN